MIAAALPDELFEKAVPAPQRNATGSPPDNENLAETLHSLS